MQAVLDKNYFEIFGLPESFRLDLSQLSQRYRDLQHQLHPDRFALSGAQERRLSVQMAALVNEAYQTLKDPVQRARYQLGLRGIDTDEELDTAMNPAFLMEQMALREALDTARQGENPLAELRLLSSEVDTSLRAHIDELEKCFTDGDDASLQKARNIVRELQFMQKILAEIGRLEEEYV